MSRLPPAALLAVLLCTAAPGVSAKDAAPAAADPALEARVIAIASELRCLVCQNQTLADSDASLAIDLREEMRTMLRHGADAEQVRAFMTQRYGDFVLYRPPLKASTLPLWAGPGVLLLCGLGALFSVLHRRKKLGDERFEPDPIDATPATEQGVTP